MDKTTAYFLIVIMVALCGCSQKENFVSTDKNASVDVVESYVVDGSVSSEMDESVIDTKLLRVPNLNQNPTLPTGCEATAVVMVLQYYKEDISIEDFAKHCLPKCEDFYSKDGALYGPDPNKFIVGDPFSKSGYGCISPVIIVAVNSNSRLCRAEKVNGSLEELCHRYIDVDKPVLIWATMNMKPIGEGNSWRLQNGESFIWPSGEHCMVLVGYDRFNYYFNDPLKGNTVGYEKKTAEERFVALGSQAVKIEPYN